MNDRSTAVDVGPSLAGLSTDAPAPSPRSALQGERYRELDVVGEGGLGTVLRAHDQFLGREVALKRIAEHVRGASDEHAQERFLREARITARLDHPNIVPIHDAGTTSDGRVYYTMRLIRGRSLAEVAAQTTSTVERLRLVGALTAACHAVGYAHRRGIIHRDLKPANIMLGEMGETQVVDWGLAEDLAEPTPRPGFAGTLPYASPEILDGTRPTIASDVWALGVSLHEVISGRHRFAGGRVTVEQQLLASPLSPARWPEDCPAELCAIGERAMALDPAARYADAHAMAEDLEAFRDGRLVAAHRYSPMELARRFVVAWRWPIAATATLVLGTIGALALTAHRTERQRERAVAAETATRTQLAETESALAETLAARAVNAVVEQAPSVAEHTALAALARREHADARGVLALVHAAPRPMLRGRFEPPGCTRVTGVTYSSAICLERDGISRWDVASKQQRWRSPLGLEGAVTLESDRVVGWTEMGTVRVLAGDTGRELARSDVLSRVAMASRAGEGERVVLHDGRTLLAVEPDGTLTVKERPCGERAIAAATTTATTAYVVCAGGELVAVDAENISSIEATGFGTDIPAATAVGISPDGLDLVIGSSAGDLALRDLRGCFSPDCEHHPRSAMLAFVERAAIRHLVGLGPVVIAIADRGDAVVVQRGSAGEAARLPLPVGHDAIGLEGGELVTGGAAWSLWQLSDQAPGALLHPRALVSGSVSSDGRIAAALSEDGELLIWTVKDGVRRHAIAVGESRAVELDAAGTVATVQRETALVRYDVASGEERERQAVTTTARGAPAVASSEHRVEALGARDTVSASVSGRRHVLAVSGTTVESLALSADARWLAVGTGRGRIDVWDLTSPTPTLRARIPAHRERVTWLGFIGTRLWSASDDGSLRQSELSVLTTDLAALSSMALATWGAPSAPED